MPLIGVGHCPAQHAAEDGERAGERALRVPSHCTGSTSWRASRAVTSPAEASGAAVTLEYTGMRGAATFTSASTCSRQHPLVLLRKKAACFVPAAPNGLRANQQAPLLIVALVAVAFLQIKSATLLEPGDHSSSVRLDSRGFLL